MGDEVLLITRSNMLKRLVEAGLAGQDVKVGVAAELGEIYSYADRHTPRVVVYDLVNAVKEEFIRIKALKNHENLKESPVIFIAGSPRLLFRHQLVSPKDTFVMRHLESKTLLQKIKELLGEPVVEEYVEPAVAVLEGVATPALWAEASVAELLVARAEREEELLQDLVAQAVETAVPDTLPLEALEPVGAEFEVAEALVQRPETEEEFLEELEVETLEKAVPFEVNHSQGEPYTLSVEAGEPIEADFEVAEALEDRADVMMPALSTVEALPWDRVSVADIGQETLAPEMERTVAASIIGEELKQAPMATLEPEVQAVRVAEPLVQEREEILEVPSFEAMEEVQAEVVVAEGLREPQAIEAERPSIVTAELGPKEEILEEASVVMEEEVVVPRRYFDSEKALQQVVTLVKASLREEMEKIAERAARKVLAEWQERERGRRRR